MSNLVGEDTSNHLLQIHTSQCVSMQGPLMMMHALALNIKHSKVVGDPLENHSD